MSAGISIKNTLKLHGIALFLIEIDGLLNLVMKSKCGIFRM